MTISVLFSAKVLTVLLRMLVLGTLILILFYIIKKRVRNALEMKALQKELNDFTNLRPTE